MSGAGGLPASHTLPCPPTRTLHPTLHLACQASTTTAPSCRCLRRRTSSTLCSATATACLTTTTRRWAAPGPGWRWRRPAGERCASLCCTPALVCACLLPHLPLLPLPLPPPTQQNYMLPVLGPMTQEKWIETAPERAVRALRRRLPAACPPALSPPVHLPAPHPTATPPCHPPPRRRLPGRPRRSRRPRQRPRPPPPRSSARRTRTRARLPRRWPTSRASTRPGARARPSRRRAAGAWCPRCAPGCAARGGACAVRRCSCHPACLAFWLIAVGHPCAHACSSPTPPHLPHLLPQSVSPGGTIILQYNRKAGPLAGFDVQADQSLTLKIGAGQACLGSFAVLRQRQQLQQQPGQAPAVPTDAAPACLPPSP